jgi:hypothetical protein
MKTVGGLRKTRHRGRGFGGVVLRPGTPSTVAWPIDSRKCAPRMDALRLVNASRSDCLGSSTPVANGCESSKNLQISGFCARILFSNAQLCDARGFNLVRYERLSMRKKDKRPVATCGAVYQA